MAGDGLCLDSGIVVAGEPNGSEKYVMRSKTARQMTNRVSWRCDRKMFPHRHRCKEDTLSVKRVSEEVVENCVFRRAIVVKNYNYNVFQLFRQSDLTVLYNFALLW